MKYRILERNYTTIKNKNNNYFVESNNRVHRENYCLEDAFNELDIIYKNACDYINRLKDNNLFTLMKYNRVIKNHNTCTVSLLLDKKVIRKYLLEGME